MLVKDVMSSHVITVDAQESAALAARLLNRYNVGALPVCSDRGVLQGMVTDRDIAVRCVAAGRDPVTTPVSQVMTRRVAAVGPMTDTAEAARLMRAEQVRRLPVTQRGKVVGLVSLADLAQLPDWSTEAAACLSDISANLRRV